MTTQAFDQARAEAFTERLLGDLSATMTTMLAVLGDRLGLFAALAEGPVSSAELAERCAIDERYAREWLHGMAAAGYVERAPGDERFALVPEHAAVLAEESGPLFLGGSLQTVAGMLRPFDGVERAFRLGGGVSQADYPDDLWDGMRRFSAPMFGHALPAWLPLAGRVAERLEQGVVAADVGCGAGDAAIALARAYPRSRIEGFDVFPGQVERARARAREAGVEDRVRFECLDVSSGLPGRYDVVTTFDVVHDAVDPRGLLRAIRAATADDGAYLLVEMNCADRAEDNVGPLAALFYGFSVFYCMTTSLAHDGAGLGTCGMPEARVRELTRDAGFGSVRRLPIQDPFSAVFEVRP